MCLGVLGCVGGQWRWEARFARSSRFLPACRLGTYLLGMVRRGWFPLAWLLACEHEDGAVSPGLDTLPGWLRGRFRGAGQRAVVVAVMVWMV